MKIDVKIDKTKNDPSGRYGITDQRMDEVQKFVDGLFLRIKKENGLDKVEAIERVIEFANSTVEAVVIYGWFEARFAEENPVFLRKILPV